MSNNAEYAGIPALAKIILANPPHDDKTAVTGDGIDFTVDTKTKIITNVSGKREFAVGDHDSERLTFQMDRYIEGHDMLLSNIACVHSFNGDTPNIYDIGDMVADESNPNKVIFSWLLSSAAIIAAGPIRFALRFKCTDDTGKETYSWGTKINEDMSVFNTLENSETVVRENVDILEQWQNDLFGAGESAISGIHSAAESEKQQIAQKGAEIIESIPDDYNALVTDVSELKGDLADLDTQLSESITEISKVNFEWIDGYYVSENGVYENTGYKWTGYIELNKDVVVPIHYKMHMFVNLAICFFDSNKRVIHSIKPTTSSSVVLVEGVIADYHDATYIGMSTSKQFDDGDTLFYGSIGMSKIANGSIGMSKIADGSVSTQKADFFVHDKNSNYITNNWIDDCYIKGDGTIIQYNGFCLSENVYLEPNTRYFYGGGIYDGYYCFFDANGEFIEGKDFKEGENPFTTPENTAYGRFTITDKANKGNAWIFTSNSTPKPYSIALRGDISVSAIIDLSDVTNPCDYLGEDISAFTKCICIGDSLTAGTMNHIGSGATEYISYDKYSFPRNLERITGLEVTNMGISGATSGEWYNNKSESDLSGYDIAIIQLGVNDDIRRNSMGKTLDEWFADDSLCGFRNIISKLKTENKNIKVFVANIIPAKSYHSDSYLEMSAYLLNWVSNEYANDKNVIPLDIQQYGHTFLEDAYNCGHLSAYGYNRLARDYKSYIGWYMSKHPEVFKEIQFIGTDYWYDNPNV